MRAILLGIGGFVAISLFHEVTYATTERGVITESVNDYCTFLGGGANCHAADTACNTEADNFWTKLATSSDFTRTTQFKDNAVFDTDFIDPDRAGSTAADNDTNNFDKNGYAISFVCAHGTCDAGTSTICTGDAGCAAGGHCLNLPPPPTGLDFSFCENNLPRRLITSTTVASHGNQVLYGNGTVAWGESASSGTWGNAGTNGGTNLVVLINSCGLTAPFYSQYASAFAGVHVVAGIMPIDGDTQDVANRGTFLGTAATTNHTSAVSTGWFATMDSLGLTTSSCPAPNGTAGGGGGMSGCGAYYTLSFDSTTTSAQFHTGSETWVNLTDSTKDATGNGAGWILWHCNYDCAANPW